MLEENFRRAMIMAQGDIGFLFGTPISAITHVLTVVFLASILFRRPLKAFLKKRIAKGLGADV